VRLTAMTVMLLPLFRRTCTLDPDLTPVVDAMKQAKRELDEAIRQRAS